MKALKAIAGLMTLVVTLPIWYYLIYQILARVQASELMWFLFWVYVPVNLFAALVIRMSAGEK